MISRLQPTLLPKATLERPTLFFFVKKIRPELRCCCLPEKRIRFGLHGVLGLQVHR
jgi:hypothetical protein